MGIYLLVNSFIRSLSHFLRFPIFILCYLVCELVRAHVLLVGFNAAEERSVCGLAFLSFNLASIMADGLVLMELQGQPLRLRVGDEVCV